MITKQTANIHEIFMEFLDGIFFEGYTVQLAENNPESYIFEFNQFIKTYK